MTIKMGEGSKRLYVGNLYPEVTNADLSKQFNKYVYNTYLSMKFLLSYVHLY